MKKKPNIYLLVTVVLLALLLLVFNVNTMIFALLDKIGKGEFNSNIAGMMSAVVYLIMTGICCYMSASIARKKNRSVAYWIFAAILTNVMALYCLYRLPKQKNNENNNNE